jgi:DNA-directed RNA polymerase specialized sigma24 family protein
LYSITKELNLTAEELNGLLAWLHADRNEAGKKYEEIRRRLIRILTCRGCTCPEDLTDETIDRVARKVPEIAPHYVGERALYFLGVAHNVFREWLRRKDTPVPMPAPNNSEEKERWDECLEQCMQFLTLRNRELILRFHQGQGRAKIAGRSEIATAMSIGANALRIRVHRIRKVLKKCVDDCLEHENGA